MRADFPPFACPGKTRMPRRVARCSTVLALVLFASSCGEPKLPEAQRPSVTAAETRLNAFVETAKKDPRKAVKEWEAIVKEIEEQAKLNGGPFVQLHYLAQEATPRVKKSRNGRDLDAALSMVKDKIDELKTMSQ